MSCLHRLLRQALLMQMASAHREAYPSQAIPHMMRHGFPASPPMAVRSATGSSTIRPLTGMPPTLAPPPCNATKRISGTLSTGSSRRPAITKVACLGHRHQAMEDGKPSMRSNPPSQARRSMSARPEARRSSTPVLAMASIRYQAITPLISTPPVISEIMCTMPRGLTNDTPT